MLFQILNIKKKVNNKIKQYNKKKKLLYKLIIYDLSFITFKLLYYVKTVTNNSFKNKYIADTYIYIIINIKIIQLFRF